MSDLAHQFEKQQATCCTSPTVRAAISSRNYKMALPSICFFQPTSIIRTSCKAPASPNPARSITYAIGRIVIWVPADSKLEVANQHWNALLDAGVNKIAIANPEHAPYGRAAVAAMEAAGIYDKVKVKLVFGENISQAAQFVQSSNAQAGIVALSLATSPAMKDGKRWEIPAATYPPIEQAVVMLKNAKNKDAARAFLEFVKSEPGRATLTKYGFALPPAGPSAAPKV